MLQLRRTCKAITDLSHNLRRGSTRLSHVGSGKRPCSTAFTGSRTRYPLIDWTPSLLGSYTAQPRIIHCANYAVVSCHRWGWVLNRPMDWLPGAFFWFFFSDFLFQFSELTLTLTGLKNVFRIPSSHFLVPSTSWYLQFMWLILYVHLYMQMSVFIDGGLYSNKL